MKSRPKKELADSTDSAHGASAGIGSGFPPVGDEPMSVQTEANRMKALLALATLGLLAAALFGFGQLLGAWDTPTPTGPETASAPAKDRTVVLDERERTRSRKPGGRRQGNDEGRLGRTGLPASVARRLDAVCRRARVDALAIAARARPTNKKRMRQLFEQLGELNEA